jgi:hypothetical protein
MRGATRSRESIRQLRTSLQIIINLIDHQDWCWEWRGRLNHTTVVELEGKTTSGASLVWEAVPKKADVLLCCKVRPWPSSRSR